VQIEIFKNHIALAEQVRKPLIVHCVRAWQELIATWRRTAPHRVPLAVHGFRGNANIARQLMKEGFYLSIGEHFNAEALAVTPHDRILIENDDSNTDITAVAAHVAATLHTSVADIIGLVTNNASTFLNSRLKVT
jgi:TatD DNase family protein